MKILPLHSRPELPTSRRKFFGYWRSCLGDVKNTAAETLMEVIIAMTILVIGAGASTTLILTTVRYNTVSEDYIVAFNLAREGVEAIRNIRDTNWLRFPGDRAACWDTYGLTDASACLTAPTIGTVDSTPATMDPADIEYYIVSPDIDIATPTKLLSWNLISEDPLTSDELLFEETIGGESFFVNIGTTGNESIFSRTISVYKPTSDEMLVTGTVTWDKGAQSYEVNFTDRLINY